MGYRGEIIHGRAEVQALPAYVRHVLRLVLLDPASRGGQGPNTHHGPNYWAPLVPNVVGTAPGKFRAAAGEASAADGVG